MLWCLYVVYWLGYCGLMFNDDGLCLCDCFGLKIMQVGIVCIECYQFVMCFVFDDFVMFQDQDVVIGVNGGQVVCDDDDGVIV